MNNLYTYICFALFISVTVIAGCATIDKNLGKAENQVQKAEVKLSELKNLKKRIEGQIRDKVERVDSTFNDYFGESIHASKDDVGIQDKFYANVYPDLGGSVKKSAKKANERIVEAYKEWQKTKNELIKINHEANKVFDDADNIVKKVNKVLDLIDEANKRAKVAKESASVIAKIAGSAI